MRSKSCRRRAPVMTVIPLMLLLLGGGVVVAVPKAPATAQSDQQVAGSSRSLGDRPRLRQITDLPGNESTPVFSPDGTRVAFSADGSGSRDIFTHDLLSGTTMPLVATAAEEYEPRWSPDGTSIAFTMATDGAETVAVVSSTGGEPIQLVPPELPARRARWSPDGRSIVFGARAESGRQAWLVSPDGSGLRALTTAGDHLPYGWSPDGQFVLVISFGREQNLWGVPVDGGPRLQITSRDGEEWWPQWSPQGDRVVFYTTWGEAMTDIWTADVATGALTQVTDLEVEDFLPAWSPDGRWLAFNSDRASKSGLWISRPDGADATPVATDGRVGSLPAWSPDGAALAFSQLATKDELYSLSAAGGETVQLTRGTHTVVEIASSPDGGSLAFESVGVGTEADLFVMNLRTNDIVRLTDETTYNARPSWSSDGTRLAFERSSGGGPRTNNVATMPVGGGEIVSLTSSGYVRRPVWCGQFIVYTVEHSATSDGPNQLWRVPAIGGEPVQITTTPGDKWPTDCSLDGTRLLYSVMLDGNRSQWLARLTLDAKLNDAVTLGVGEGGRWSRDEQRIAFISSRDGTTDIYTASAEGLVLERITNDATVESPPDWGLAPDQILFTANLGGRDIWIANVGDLVARR